ncbi:mitochondrial transcription rescue factor 1 [Crotalus tigris]|uniref:Putative C6orf203-like protein n=1 Tax=Crotalus adamanteus TaxID=8729 RepID=A0A0F7ZDH0_CROAD|nr:mitochondrial transcription rescue factor 1 [Crotalus tigris]XP_039207045.1 mitochondrial transcription rescue factor 1 [Crotalus tigris]XP_039207046.1 mitochondrial transcription rescue factor 1 [Crotalus tigris]XP_039207047.1 mitochondrial transcription rescue factor 1 [Crotalus tigris]XP_039207049.1 mitochondrial transcription rescue factor 1 [Crotalus tigris]XP_039207050.1 mitochondrial transcription rescue factor 1 [Crotalus tigris]XP_039207051.1 mitochondrial transcription rescue fac
MTGYKLLLGAFRNLNVWLGILVKSPHKLHSPWKTFLCATSQHPKRAILPKHFCDSPIQQHVFLVPWSKSVSGILVRHKSNKSSHKNVKKTVEEDLEEEDTVEEITDSEDEFEDDPSIVKNYKDLEKVVQSFRFDVILKSGLDIARNKVEDAFYNGELRLNGEKLWKKSRSVKVGDTLDLILGEDKETETAVVMRVVLRKASEKNENDKYKVVLRRWKNLKVPKQDVLK